MKGKIYFYIILFVILGSIAFITLESLRTTKANGVNLAPDAVVLYWGEGCPHCKVVDDFLASHKEIEEKIKIERKEVYNNEVNALELTDRAKACKLPTKDGVAVPFLYFKGECITGDQPIIDYLTKKSQ